MHWSMSLTKTRYVYHLPKAANTEVELYLIKLISIYGHWLIMMFVILCVVCVSWDPLDPGN